MALCLSTQHRKLCRSVIVSEMSFSTTASGEQTTGLQGHCRIIEDTGGMKAEMLQMLSGDNTAENEKTICSQLVHHSEIIVLLRKPAVQVAKQICVIIAQTTHKQALYLGLTYMLSKGTLGGWKINLKKVCPW